MSSPPVKLPEGDQSFPAKVDNEFAEAFQIGAEQVSEEGHAFTV